MSYMEIITTAIQRLQDADDVETFLSAHTETMRDLVDLESQLREHGGAAIQAIPTQDDPFVKALTFLFARIDTVSVMLMCSTQPDIYAKPQVAAMLQAGEETADDFAAGLSALLKKP